MTQTNNLAKAFTFPTLILTTYPVQQVLLRLISICSIIKAVDWYFLENKNI